MRNVTLRGLAFFVMMGLIFPALATNGYFAHGYGTKSKGMVGAGSALPEDAMAAATNPAGMVMVGNRMDVGGALFSPSPRSYEASGASGVNPGDACGLNCPFEIGPQKIESENDYFIIPHFARNWMLDDKSSAGITIYGNGGMNTEYKGGTAMFNNGAGVATQANGTFGSGKTGVDLAQLFFNLSYARKISESSSYGASLILAYQRFKAEGLNTFGNFALSNDPNNLSDNGYDSSTGYGAKFGWMGQVTAGLSFAASYQSRIYMSEFDKYAGLFAEQGDFDIPPTWTIGMALTINDKSHVVFDVQRIYFSKIASVGNPMMPALGLCFQPPLGPGDTSRCLGADDGPGFGWDDMTIYKLGYEISPNDKMTWRVGYSRTDQPIPDSEVMFNILAPAVVEEHITFGFTNKLSQQSEFSFALMYALENSVTGPNPLDPAQEIELEMSQFELEGSYSKKF